jgi:L-ribulose-5-phosphate 4-epimerase
MVPSLKRKVCDANLELVRRGLVIQTWGNASAIDRDRGLVVIKPSGVDYSRMKPADMVVVSLDTGEIIDGRLKPSSDTPTHLVLYRALDGIQGIVHTHSLHATAWAQAGHEIPALGTTHADHWHGPVPCTRPLDPAEIASDYEVNTGRVILERFEDLDPRAVPAVLVASHGPFAWGESVESAVECAAVLEFVAHLASETLRIAPRIGPISNDLLERHFCRKHGEKACYGQGTGRGVADLSLEL